MRSLLTRRRLLSGSLLTLGLALLMGSKAPPLASPTGTIRGNFVSLERLKTRGATSQRDVVLFLREKQKGEHAPPAEPAVITQRKLQFEPHVLPVLAGTKVVFANEDDVEHNVFSSEACCPVDIDMGPNQQSDYTFSEPGIVSIVCRLHPEMSTWVVVLENPWFTRVELDKVADDDGRSYTAPYAIEGVPPGEYTLSFWNKKLTPVELPVVVEAGKETVLDVQVGE